MKPLHVLGICGSLRQQSTNFGLLRYAKKQCPVRARNRVGRFTRCSFLQCRSKEIPPTQKLNESIERADALLLACPEYNYSLAPALKNALDWASRAPENHLLAGKPLAILGSGGGMGSARVSISSQTSLRISRSQPVK